MIEIRLFGNFRKKFKNLAKKNKHIINDLKELESTLKQTPSTGTFLGYGLYKIRMANSSKNIGKRGGFRVITYFINDDNTVYLVEIYEKNDIENIPLQEIKDIISKEMSN